MARSDQAERYRKWYACLIRLYPGPFRERFGESMEQTFNDLCRERQETGNSLLRFMLWVFLEASVGIVKENIRSIAVPYRLLTKVTLFATALVLVPVAASFFIDGWNWPLAAYAGAWIVFALLGLGYTAMASMGDSVAYSAAIGLGAIGVFLLVWVTGAVGIIGSEENPANVMYIGVLVVGAFGIVLTRLDAMGMTGVMCTVAMTQMLVPTIALLFWNTDIIIAGESFWGDTGAFSVFLLNAGFAAIWLGSALLFLLAARKKYHTLEHR